MTRDRTLTTDQWHGDG